MIEQRKPWRSTSPLPANAGTMLTHSPQPVVWESILSWGIGPAQARPARQPSPNVRDCGGAKRTKKEQNDWKESQTLALAAGIRKPDHRGGSAGRGDSRSKAAEPEPLGGVAFGSRDTGRAHPAPVATQAAQQGDSAWASARAAPDTRPTTDPDPKTALRWRADRLPKTGGRAPEPRGRKRTTA